MDRFFRALLKTCASPSFVRTIRLFVRKIDVFVYAEQQDCKDEQQGLYLIVYSWSVGRLTLIERRMQCCKLSRRPLRFSTSSQ
jgi:hypothetical protein